MPPPAGHSCAMCKHCGDGILYNTYYFSCLICNLNFCNSCHSSHPRSHLRFIKECIDVQRPRDSIPDPKDCSICRKSADARVQCSECYLNTCYQCYEEAEGRDIWVSHEHQFLTMIRIPDDYGLVYYDADCTSCRQGESWVHCGTCYAGIKEGEHYHWCKHCAMSYLDLSPTACTNCLPTVLANHAPGHKFIDVIYTELSGVEENHFSVVCLACTQSFNELSGASIFRHPHTRFQIGVGAGERERILQKSYRMCPRAGVKNLDRPEEALHDGILGCGCCWEAFEKDPKTYFCRDCCFSSCARCHEQGITKHRHPMLCMDLKITTMPPDLYKQVIDGTNLRGCDICKEDFHPATIKYAQCSLCNNYDVCLSCLLDSPDFTMIHDSCTFYNQGTLFFQPAEMSDAWMKNQEELAAAYGAEKAAKEEAEFEHQRQAQLEVERRASAAAARQTLAVPASRVGRTPSPSPKISSVSLAAPQPQVARRKSSSGLGTALLKGALAIGKGIVLAEMQQQGGGGYSGGGVGGYSSGGFSSSNSGLDMSSFWGPINSAAQDPIQ